MDTPLEAPGGAAALSSAPPPDPAAQRPLEQPRGRDRGALERLASFRFTYLAIFLFLVAYVFTVQGLQRAMTKHFRQAVAEAARVDPARGPVAPQVQDRIQQILATSLWVRLGVRVRPIVLGADGVTLLYAGGRTLPPPTFLLEGNAHLLPAIVDVEVSVPHNALIANIVLVGYASLLLTTLYLYTRHLIRSEQARLAAITQARDASARRAEEIERELAAVRNRLSQVEPEKEVYADEIRALEDERVRLLQRLGDVERREEALRTGSARSMALEEEHRALEELLEEAVQDVARREEEIRTLQKQVKRSGRERGREAEQIGRRLRTLYKNLEVDDHALEDLAALGDEGLRLKAEEALKRLSDESDGAAVRRKVGGLPPHLAIFELGFAGKGRIYYTKGRSRRFRVLRVGAKNSQKADLEYLSRLPKE